MKTYKSKRLMGSSLLLGLALVAGQAATRSNAEPTSAVKIYPAASQAGTDLAAALAQAAKSHRRVIIDFGGNWCPDCRVLDSYFHDPVNKPLLDAGFILVHVNVERMTDNLDIAARYQIPLKKGVPALAVLASDGTLLYSQKGGEFESMRDMHAQAVTQFLQQWSPAPKS